MGNSLYVSNTRALPAGINTINKIDNPFADVCWVSVFNNIFCAATNFGITDSFLLPNSRNEEMMGDGFTFVLYCASCFEQ